MDQLFEQQLQERFTTLPPALQNAITSADIEKHLRELSTTHQLHIDQWNKLENEVMLTLLGLQHSDELVDNIKNHVGLTTDVAQSLAGDIMKVVFEPVREELERILTHPDAQEVVVSGVETARSQVLAAQTPAVAPLVAPTDPQTAKADRAPLPESYTATPSHERKTVVGDPYREQLK